MSGHTLKSTELLVKRLQMNVNHTIYYLWLMHFSYRNDWLKKKS